MCIRDSHRGVCGGDGAQHRLVAEGEQFLHRSAPAGDDDDVCLLYTSDAADERSSVDLGGRRIIKKKTHVSCTQNRHIILRKPPHRRTEEEP